MLLCQPALQVHKPSRQTEDHTSAAQPCSKTQWLWETTSRALRQHFRAARPCTALLPGTRSQRYPPARRSGQPTWGEWTSWAPCRTCHTFQGCWPIPSPVSNVTQPSKQCFAGFHSGTAVLQPDLALARAVTRRAEKQRCEELGSLLLKLWGGKRSARRGVCSPAPSCFRALPQPHSQGSFLGLGLPGLGARPSFPAAKCLAGTKHNPE